LLLHRAAVHPHLNALGEIDAERKLNRHLRRLGTRRLAHQHRDQQAVALIGDALK
jgi:hypothetical protein